MRQITQTTQTTQTTAISPSRIFRPSILALLALAPPSAVGPKSQQELQKIVKAFEGIKLNNGEAIVLLSYLLCSAVDPDVLAVLEQNTNNTQAEPSTLEEALADYSRAMDSIHSFVQTLSFNGSQIHVSGLRELNTNTNTHTDPPALVYVARDCNMFPHRMEITIGDVTLFEIFESLGTEPWGPPASVGQSDER